MGKNKAEPETLCRACTSPHNGDKVDLLNVPNLARLFIRITATQIDPNDSLPKQICGNCYDCLDSFDRFQIMCSDSYKSLAAMFPRSGIKEEYHIGEIAAATEEAPEFLTSITVPAFGAPDIQYEIIGKPEVNRKFDQLSADGDNPDETVDNSSYVDDINATEMCDGVDIDQMEQVTYSWVVEDIQTNDSTFDGENMINSEIVVENFVVDNVGFEGANPTKKMRKRNVPDGVDVSLGGTPRACGVCPLKFWDIEKYESHVKKHQNRVQRGGIKAQAKKNKQDKREQRQQKTKTNRAQTQSSELQTSTEGIRKKGACCDICRKALSSKGAVVRHIEQVHMGIRKHICKICDRAFADKRCLIRHQKSHLSSA